MIVAIAGGVGGAKLAAGLAKVLPPSELTIAVNTGDDFEHLGLHISPDLDTVMYNLAGRQNLETGWGLRAETWNFMQALGELGGDTWFRLGDADLATHIERTLRLRRGDTLTAVTAHLARNFGIEHELVPMSDDPVRTVVHTDQGVLAFQEYFVRQRCEPKARRIEYAGLEIARMGPGLRRALESGRLRAVVICPSNPCLSVAPVLGIPGLRQVLAGGRVPVIAVSPIVAGKAIKGPAAKVFEELGLEPSAVGVARYYQGLVDVLVIDNADRQLAPAIRALGMRACITDTIMRNDEDRIRLANEVIALVPPKAPA